VNALKESSQASNGPASIGGRVLGAGLVPVLAGPRRGADLVHVSLRRHHGTVDAAAELAKIRDIAAVPLLVEPFSAADLGAVADCADGLVVGGSWMQDFRLLSAVGDVGLPVVIHRGQHNTVAEWLASVDYVMAGSAPQVVLAEGGYRARGDDRPVLDLALIREAGERSGLPVLADVSVTPWLAGAAVAAGAAGLWLAEESPVAEVDAAREAVAVLAPNVAALDGVKSLAGIGELRSAIDRVDAALATLLEHRVRLAGEIQQHKPIRGHAGRNPAREAQIVHAMTHRAPTLSRDALAKIMDAVITAGLDAAEQSHPPVWRL